MAAAPVEINHLRLPPAFDLLALHELNPRRYPFLLQSVADGTPQGRYDILFGWPGERLVLDGDYRLSGPGSHPGRFLDALDHDWASTREESTAAGQPPFRGGWFLFLGYELAAEVEARIPRRPALQLPVAIAVRVPVAIIHDRLTGNSLAIAEQDSRACLADLARDVAQVIATPAPVAIPGKPAEPLAMSILEPEPERFMGAVRRAKHYIAAGDIFQANLARRWTGRAAAGVSAADVHRRLRITNPAPFSGLATFDDFAIVSSSPERLVRVEGREVDTRPIAGTRPRGLTPAGERENRRALLASAKERAEHVMLIDLERNDLGRICEAGSVAVNEFMVVESYSHVHHIVSNVRGRLRPDTTPGEVIRAVFPGGTITGCPKVRCMEIINELEDLPRGPYTGAMGYLNRDGSCDLNILIRTILLQGDLLSFAAGSGIVADSDPQRELDETRAKAKGLLLALESAP